MYICMYVCVCEHARDLLCSTALWRNVIILIYGTCVLSVCPCGLICLRSVSGASHERLYGERHCSHFGFQFHHLLAG